jgi:MFS family permease
MAQPPQTDDLATHVRTMQTVLGAIVLGAVVFLAIAVVVRSRSEQPAPNSLVFSYAALGIALGNAIAYYFVIDAITAAQRRRIAQGVPDPQRAWYAAYGTQLFAGAAMLEGAAFLLIIAYLVEGSWSENWMPILAAVGIIAFLVTLFPTRSGVEKWVREQQEKLRAEQSGRR